MFQKMGIIGLPASRPAWIHSHAFVPNAFMLNDKTIRIILAFWADNKIGRAGYMDVSADNPLELLGYSEKPSLDIGEPGAFDDNGVSPLCLIRKDDGRLWMYYAGWQLNDKIRYIIYAGLAESRDDGASFTRVKKTPVLERSDSEMLMRSGSCVYRDGDKWKMVYAAGSKTFENQGKITPTYGFNIIESSDGLHWPESGKTILSPSPEKGEFGFGRAFVMKENNIWKIWYGIRHMEHGYSMGYGESSDGEKWVRKDEVMKEFNEKTESYDNETRSFPSIVSTKKETFLFYNGNSYGKEGVCVARVIK